MSAPDVEVKMKRLPLNKPNYTIHRAHDKRALWRMALLLFSGLLLTGGFIFAAGQRFTAIHYGYKSESLRRERDQLTEQRRRLLLAREEASTPARLESEARRLGLQPVSPEQVEPASRATGRLPRVSAALAAPSAALNH